MTEKIFQKQGELQKTAYIPRTLFFDKDMMKLKKIICLVGPRRSGKTTYMLQIINTLIESNLLSRKQVVYIDFNDHIGGKYDFEQVLQNYKYHYPDEKPMFFLDEIQEVENMRSGVFFLYNLGYQVFVTGSNSKLLSSELSTHFRGKSLEIFIQNLDFEEYCLFRGVDRQNKSYDDRAKLYNAVQDFLYRGGYPEIVLAHGNQSLQTKIIKNYMDVMIYKDLMERYKISNEYVLKFMIQQCIVSHSKQFNINKLNNHLKSLGIKIDKNLLYTILDHLQSVFFVDILRQQYKRQGFKKIYLVDNIYQTIYQDSDDVGKKFENAVYQKLKKDNADLCYNIDNGCEIDFIDDKGRKIQVCRDWNDNNTIRETKSLGSGDLLIYGQDARTIKEPLSCTVLRYDEFL